MKKYSDRQKYLIIMWYYLLKDVQENDIENAIERKYPGYKIDWPAMSKRISWAAEFKNIRECPHPWIIQTKNEDGVILHLPFKELCDLNVYE